MGLILCAINGLQLDFVLNLWVKNYSLTLYEFYNEALVLKAL